MTILRSRAIHGRGEAAASTVTGAHTWVVSADPELAEPDADNVDGHVKN